MRRIRRHFKTALVAGANAVYSPRAISRFKLDMDGFYLRERLRFGEAYPSGRPTALPSPVAAGTHRKRFTQDTERVVAALRVYPSVLHRTSCAKYAVAFFRISTCNNSRLLSACSRASSMASGVTLTDVAASGWALNSAV